MFNSHQICLAAICILPPVVILFCCSYAYRVNEKRAHDDPEKKEFFPHAIWLAPITLPFLILFNILFLVLSALGFGLILILFPLSLLLLRKPFLIKWILASAQKVGNKLLKINTELLKFAVFYPTAYKHKLEQQVYL